jgi:hypothetical protein
VVARQLQGIGLRVRVTDRRFDEHTRRSDDDPAEPRLALAGFDKIAPRRLLEGAGFSQVVDAGIGVGPIEYLGIDVHTFPSSRKATEVFIEESSPDTTESLLDQPAYCAAAVDAMTSGGVSTVEAARCGLIDVAGKAAGAAFVGTVAATIAFSELLRIVNEGCQYETITLNLRTPDGLVACRAPRRSTVGNPGFVAVE